MHVNSGLCPVCNIFVSMDMPHVVDSADDIYHLECWEKAVKHEDDESREITAQLSTIEQSIFSDLMLVFEDDKEQAYKARTVLAGLKTVKSLLQWIPLDVLKRYNSI